MMLIDDLEEEKTLNEEGDDDETSYRDLEEEKAELEIKEKEEIETSDHFINNDLAPNLGNEALAENNLSESQLKSKLKNSKIANFLNKVFIKNPSLKSEIKQAAQALKSNNVKFEDKALDLNNDGIVDNNEVGQDKMKSQTKEHRQQFADAVNNIGENSGKGNWVGKLADSEVKDTGRGR